MAAETQNKMAVGSINKLIWQMGLPMIVSMILQAVYNIVDTAFVINMGEDGIAGNLALTYAFPVQLLMIAIGVGTGVGIKQAALSATAYFWGCAFLPYFFCSACSEQSRLSPLLPAQTKKLRKWAPNIS